MAAGTAQEQLESGSQLAIRLLEHFEFRAAGVPVPLPPACRRLLAYLALQDQPRARVHVVGALWPDIGDVLGRGRLRSTLWRCRPLCPGAVVADEVVVQLAPHVEVDVHRLDPSRPYGDAGSDGDEPPDGTLLFSELLPGWYDDWVQSARDRLRQLQLRALDRRCEWLLQNGRTADAIDLAERGVGLEPLRESTYRALVAAHVAERNVAEAVRQYRRYAALLKAELGAEPSSSLRGLLDDDIGAG
jgi:DNA-binding SARP family transcriptional activator